ncbi:MAG: alpha-galactosidase [Armatimonadetes bacterium]|nr:alpha-galactosidase [Armatimonadota bacterium]
MSTHATLILAGMALAALGTATCAAMPTKDEIAACASWTKSHLQGKDSAGLPFSFSYDGKQSYRVLSSCKFEESAKDLDKSRKQWTLTWTDPSTGLQVRCVSVHYRDYPTVEWTLYFKNTGNADTPLLTQILPLDIQLKRNARGEFLLHHFKGSPCEAADYQPLATELGPGATKRIGALDGRPCNTDLPNFNIEWPGQGVIVVVGWPGQWSSEFARDAKNGLTVKAGQELTHFKLHPGEEVRTPLIVMQFYSGDWVRAQNVWRKWMIDYNVPRQGGKALPVRLAADSSIQFGEMVYADTQSQLTFIDRYIEEKIPIDYWWMDAGWYPHNKKEGWPNTGTWEVDEKRFPGGFRPITDHAHQKGIDTIVWFEPERVTPGTWLYGHPEWLLTNPKEPNGWKLLDMGNPDARKWVTDHIDKMLTEQGIDLYRQDFNIDPLVFWRAADSEDRRGITEIQYVQGYLAYWDALRERHPNMLIDSCASGGRRNELETMRRSVPLWRSDYPWDPTGLQCQTYGISFWYPYYGTGIATTDTYHFRSALCPHLVSCFDVRSKELDYDKIRRMFSQWKNELGPNYYGDYYPLTEYSLEKNVWMAWQWNRPEVGQGAVQAFRRDECPDQSATFKLFGLDSKARYSLNDLDRGDLGQFTGSDLMTKGLTITLKEKREAAVVVYSKS